MLGHWFDTVDRLHRGRLRSCQLLRHIRHWISRTVTDRGLVPKDNQ